MMTTRHGFWQVNILKFLGLESNYRHFVYSPRPTIGISLSGIYYHINKTKGRTRMTPGIKSYNDLHMKIFYKQY